MRESLEALSRIRCGRTPTWLGVCAAILLAACSDGPTAMIPRAPGSPMMPPSSGMMAPGMPPSPPAGPMAPLLAARGRYLVDARGGAVFLRGVNLAGDSKLPPFVPLTDPSRLDPLQNWGLDAIRLVVIWEAAEPAAGQWDESYLAKMAAIVDAAWQRGIFTIVDFHQDGFSRYTSGGCGDGFPQWALSPDIAAATPDNGVRCELWPAAIALDPAMHRCFTDFHADRGGARTRFLATWRKMARTFATHEGVIGYDLLNEPWGSEEKELAALYEDATAAIRAEHPSAILFMEGHATTNNGTQTKLPKPSFDNFAYAPHYYDPLAEAAHAYGGVTTAMDQGFATMEAKAAEWNVPLVLGEFGFGTLALGAPAYIDALLSRIDAYNMSGLQWNFTPSWTPTLRDKWNNEDMSVVDEKGLARPTMRMRPYPRRVAGTPTHFAVELGESVELGWNHVPAAGETVLFIPQANFFLAGHGTVEASGPGLGCSWDEPGRLLTCRSDMAGSMTVRVRKE